MLLPPHGSIKAAAVCNLNSIKELLDAPIHLIGHSYGGLVAFEMAGLMAEEGKAPASVTVIDTYVPELVSGKIRDFTNSEILRRFTNALELFYETRLAVDNELVTEGTFDVYLEALTKALKSRKLMPASAPKHVLKGPLVTFARAYRSMSAPTRYYEGNINVIIARDSGGEAKIMPHEEDILKAWQPYTKNVTLRLLPGSHFSILRSPHVKELVGWWQSTLEMEP